MNLEKLEYILKDEPKFRFKQAKQAVFIDLIDDWSQVTNFPLALRDRLNQECSLEIKSAITKSREADSTKTLVYLNDGLKIETVLLNHADGRNTVCVSSQVGCALNCSFCATGKMGFKRNLTVSEIIEQVLFFSRGLKKENAKVNNLVFMGMGEPFLNYENVMAAIRMLNNKDGLNIGARHISISTVGIIDGIKKLAEEPMQINLALSLHASNDDLRVKIIPANQKYPLEEIIGALNNYLTQSGRRVMIEYLMINGFNDGKEEAQELVRLLKKISPPLFFVNLIAYNQTSDFEPSPAKRIKEFKLALNKQGIEVTERYRFGRDINAACGQLAIEE